MNISTEILLKLIEHYTEVLKFVIDPNLVELSTDFNFKGSYLVNSNNEDLDLELKISDDVYWFYDNNYTSLSYLKYTTDDYTITLDYHSEYTFDELEGAIFEHQLVLGELFNCHSLHNIILKYVYFTKYHYLKLPIEHTLVIEGYYHCKVDEPLMQWWKYFMYKEGVIEDELGSFKG